WRAGTVDRSYERPRIAAPAGIDRELAGLHQPARPPQDGLALGGLQQLRERRWQRARREAAHVVEQGSGHGLLAEVPDHGAELGLDVKAEAVVDAVDGAVLGQQAVAALAVRVVGDE